MNCPKTGNPYRHASENKIPRVERIADLKTKTIQKKTTYENKGVFCNNDGRHYIRDLKVCPASEALGVPLVPYVESEFDWMRRHAS